MKLRKGLILMVSLCVMSLGILAGCGSDDSPKEPADTSKEGNGQGSEGGSDTGGAGYVFESGSVKIAVDADMAPIAEALGEPASYFEEPSCAAQGIAKLYTYSGFTVETYPDGDKDLVACVILKDDTVATPEGVDLSMTKDKVIEVYGEDYQEASGSMTYEKGGMKLRFILDGENIASIEYNSSVLD